jgi:hypothetical protein
MFTGGNQLMKCGRHRRKWQAARNAALAAKSLYIWPDLPVFSSPLPEISAIMFSVRVHAPPRVDAVVLAGALAELAV